MNQQDIPIPTPRQSNVDSQTSAYDILPRPDRCIACTACTVVCPVAKATPDYLGPRLMGPAYERFRLAGLGEDISLHYCSNCKNCEITCPNNVPIASFILQARANASQKEGYLLRDWILAHGELIAKATSFIPKKLANAGMNFSLIRHVLDWLGIAKEAPLPRFAPAPFVQSFRQYQQPSGLEDKAVFFPGCFVNIYDPQCGHDIVWLLNRAGYKVIVPANFVCCGLPMLSNGFMADARKNAHRNIDELQQWQEQGIPVITGCTSCSLMFKEDYNYFFADFLPPGTSSVIEDACEFIASAIARQRLRLPDVPLPASVIYHAPCHLRAQGMGLPGYTLLQQMVPDLLNADAGCCGISGSYGFKKDKYSISMDVGHKLFTTIKTSKARVCASECGTCRVQIAHGTNVPVQHPLSILRHHLETNLP